MVYGVSVRADTKGCANAVAATSVSPPTTMDVRNRISTIAAARARDQSGGIAGCGDTILTTRARRPDAVNTAGAVCIGRGVALRFDSFTRHSAYDFAEPVTATVNSS